MAKKDVPVKASPAPVAVASEVTVTLAEPIDVNMYLPGGTVVAFRAGKATVTPDVADKLKKLGY